MAKIAFIGLGNMGAPMAINLVKAGHSVRAFDLSTEAVQKVAAEGAVGCESAVDSVQEVEILVTMLPAGKFVEGVLLTNEALFDQLNPETLIIDASTIDAATSKKMAAEAAQRNFSFIDAPVSGGTAGAAAGTLSFMVGGSEADFQRAMPILQCMGKNIFHAGDSGAGQVAKACNNMLLAILMAGTAEALNLGINNGMDPSVLSEIMSKSSGSNWTLDCYNPVPGVMENVPASRDYQGGFFVDLMGKDLGLAMDISQTSSSAVPMGSTAKSLFNLHQAQGKGSLDFSSIIQLFTKEG
jgi:3-hydroxyisobutyrate dehydrogenase